MFDTKEKMKKGSVSNLSISYESHVVLDKVSFDFYAGDLTFLAGPSGGGKTSLFYTFNRLSEHFPSMTIEGNMNLHIANSWVSIYPQLNISMSLLRSKVAMVFQTPHLLPGSVRNNFFLPLKLVRKLSPELCESTMQSALEKVSLWDDLKSRLDKPAQRLSVGQQQRMCLARALAMEPEFLFLDEPTASLDNDSAQEILSLLRNMKDRYTTVMISHSEREWEQYADRVWLVRDGAIRLLNKV